MALETVAQGDLFDTNQVHRGVIETVIESSPIFAMLPFLEVVGNALQYTRELTLPGGEFYNPGDTWTEGTPTFEQVTAALKILGRDADVDAFLRATRRNHYDLRAEVIAFTAKSVARTFEDTFIYGEDGTDPKSFDGLHAIMDSGQVVDAGVTTAGGPGTFSKLDQMIDLVKPNCDALIMHRRARRGIRKLARSQGWDLALSTVGAINKPVLFYSDIPILVNDFQTITEDVANGQYSAKTGDDTETIFGVHFGVDGIHGLRNGPMFAVEEVAERLESKDASRDRIKAYTSLACKNVKALAMLSAIDDQDWTN